MISKYLEHVVIEQAKKSNCRYRLGAIIVNYKDQIISAGHNSYKSHPIQARLAMKVMSMNQITSSSVPCGPKIINSKKIFLHAEIITLIRSPITQNMILIVGRILKNGKLAMAKPCEICQEYIKETGIRETFYSNQYGEWQVL